MTAALKQKLSHIPEEIKDRSKFLLIIRHIASAIKDVLDAVNEVSQGHKNDPRMSREHRKVRRVYSIIPVNGIGAIMFPP